MSMKASFPYHLVLEIERTNNNRSLRALEN